MELDPEKRAPSTMSTMLSINYGKDGAVNSREEPMSLPQRELFPLIAVAEKVVADSYLPRKITDWQF